MTRTECTYEITKLVELNVDYKRKSASVQS
jgi:hypothetical protein